MDNMTVRKNLGKKKTLNIMLPAKPTVTVAWMKLNLMA